MAQVARRGDDQALKSLRVSSRLLQKFLLLEFLEGLPKLLLRLYISATYPGRKFHDHEMPDPITRRVQGTRPSRQSEGRIRLRLPLACFVF